MWSEVLMTLSGVVEKAERPLHYIRSFGVVDGSKIVLVYTCKQVKRGLSYIHAFGAVHGARMLFTVWLKRGTIQLRMPEVEGQVYLRTKTSDLRVFEDIFVAKHYHCANLEREPKWIVDAGANVGYSALFFALQHPSARVIAIEPEPSNFALLVQNTRTQKNVLPIHAALWPVKASLEIANPQAEKWSFQVHQTTEASAHPVQAMTMEDVMQLTEGEPIDVLKIDIEGAEKEVFGADVQSWLPRVHSLMIELHDRKVEGCRRSVYQAAVQCGLEEVRGIGRCSLFVNRSLAIS